MEKMATIANSTLTSMTPHGSTKAPSNTSGPAPSTASSSVALANDLFGRMIVICTAWRQAALSDPDKWAAAYKRELVESMVRLGVRDQAQITAGMRWLKERASDWLPNPEAFARACVSQPIAGLPTEAQAFRMAVDWGTTPHAERHPAVLAALRELDDWSWRRQSDAEARKQFREAWVAVIERVRLSGLDALPQVPHEIEQQPEQATVSKAEGVKRIAEIRAKIFAGQNTGAEK